MLEYFVTSDALLCPPSGLYVSYMTFVGGVAQGNSNTKIPTLNSSVRGVRIRPGSRLSLVPCELLRLMNLFEGFGRLSSAASSSFSGGGGGAGAFLLLR